MLIDNANDANQRYRGMSGLLTTDKSIDYIIVDGCNQEGGDVSVIYRNLLGKGKDTTRTMVLSERLNMTKFSFGYFYSDELEAGAYISRNPRRATHQGISADTIIIDDNMHLTSSQNPRYHISRLIYTQGFSDMLQGKFNFDVDKMAYLADKSAEEDLPRVHYPISKNFSLIRSSELLGETLVSWKGDSIVGKFNNKRIELADRYGYLTDQIKRININVA